MTASPHSWILRLGAGSLLAMALVACGGDDDPKGADAPRDADVTEFCSVVSELTTDDADKFVDDLMKIGTPAGIPAPAREGFEVMIDQATADEISEGDQKKVLALTTYLGKTCAAVPAG
ncbi:hypothetical protein [Nocardioides sp.]|uniref:hypothetical protein n=1 Tax=Nocardioides sp. TaxID=35761 RepID=UPI0037849770